MTEPSLVQISEHVYWLPPHEPVRPALCAVVGKHRTLMLDAGASGAHARLFLERLAALGILAPNFVALTHWHWDHVFGAAELGIPVIAHTRTAEKLAYLAGEDWSDAGLEARVVKGEQTAAGIAQLKLELPAPRDVWIAEPTIIFEDALTIELGGGVECRIQHVGGDHADDSTVMYVLPDRVLFLGDCLYGSIYPPAGSYTTSRLLPLTNALLAFDAEQFIGGHNTDTLAHADAEPYINTMRLAATLVETHGTNEETVLTAVQVEIEGTPDETLVRTIRALIAGETAR